MCRNQSLLKKLLWSVSPGLDPLEGAEIWAESFPFFVSPAESFPSHLNPQSEEVSSLNLSSITPPRGC
jgi:hypothetical protein